MLQLVESPVMNLSDVQISFEVFFRCKVIYRQESTGSILFVHDRSGQLSDAAIVSFCRNYLPAGVTLNHWGVWERAMEKRRLEALIERQKRLLKQRKVQIEKSDERYQKLFILSGILAGALAGASWALFGA